MKITARDMVVWIQAQVKSLAISSGSLHAAMTQLSKNSGVSVSAIHKLYDGRADNPSANTIDKLVAAIKLANRRAA